MVTEKKSFADKYAQSSRSEGGSSGSFADKFKKKAPVNTAESITKKDPTNTSKASLVYLVKGIDDGRKAWYYVLVERLKLSMFLKALNDDIIHLEEYGKILYSAYGEEPPQDITDKLKAEYGID